MITEAALAKPRQPGPPWPEASLLFRESFDQPYRFGVGEMLDQSIWAESWSGYCLNRSGTVCQAWMIPMVASNTAPNGAWNVDPIRGAIRFWYKPSSQSAVTSKAGVLLSLVSTNRGSSIVWWTLVAGTDGRGLALICQGEEQAEAVLDAAVDLKADEWHLVTLGYSETNTALFVDDQAVAAGAGLREVPWEVGQISCLLVGSAIDGTMVAQGQIDELATFTGRQRFPRGTAYQFGLNTEWEVVSYYNVFSPVAALGPITEAEEAALRERALARQAERLAAQQAALLSGAVEMDGPLDGDFQLDSFDPDQGFRLLTPEITEGTNVFLTLANCDTSIGYDIWHAPDLSSNSVWSIVATGTMGQATFTLPMVGSEGWYRGAVGGDWDGDGIPNWMDADPRSTNAGVLTLTIDSPANGSVLY